MKELKLGDLVRIRDNCDWHQYARLIGKIGIYIRENDDYDAYPFSHEVFVGGCIHTAFKETEIDII